MWRTIILVAVLMTVASASGCVRRQSQESGDHDGHYCVCNATYCDTIPDVTRPHDHAKYTLITSSKNGLRFQVTRAAYENISPHDLSLGKITVHRKQKYQNILGFGGAVTDSASFNIYSLSDNTVNNLLRSYFGPGGIEYNMIRTPMGVSDFSWRPYSYAMEMNDTSLSKFSLTREDYFYKIPIIKKALRMKNGKIKLLTTPWSPSPWIKTNNDWTNEGSLRSEYQRIWADYFVKYFRAYRLLGLKFWAVSPQNQPLNYMYGSSLSMRMSAEEQRDWIIEHLSPTLKKAGFGNIKILVGEENWPFLSELAENILQDKKAREITSGVAVHWDTDNVTGTDALDELKQLFPEKFLINTEASSGTLGDDPVILGSWQRGEDYAKSIIESMSHWVSGWIDWNIALNLAGGPSFWAAEADSAIIVNVTADEFYKQPIFYALGHFSKYVPPRSVRVGTTSAKIEGIENIAFSTPDGGTVLIILNLDEKEKEILIEDPVKGITKVDVLGKSINTMKYW